MKTKFALANTSIVRWTAAVTAILLLLSFTACAGDNSNPDQNETPTPTGEATPGGDETPETLYEQRAKLTDELPVRDFNQREFRIMSRDRYFEFWSVEDYSGSVVDMAVFTANSAVEEQFNVVIVNVDGGAGDVDEINTIKTSISVGDDDFDIAFGHDMLTPQASIEGYFLDIYEVPHLNLDKPWWSAAGLSEFTVNDICYLGLSSISYMGIARARVLYLNEDLFADNGLTLPYDDVLCGNWTLEKLIELTEDFYVDKNANDTVDAGDVFGFGTEGGCYGFFENFGINVIEKDDALLLRDGIDLFQTSMVVERVYDWLIDGKGAYMTDDANASCNETFAAGELLFAHGELNSIVNLLRQGEMNFGIIPMPKYEEAQKDYVTSCVDWPFVFACTATEEQLDFAGLIVEAMSFEGYKEIFPVYYETVLEDRYFDGKSIEMLQIINRTATMSFSFVYDTVGVDLAIYHMMCSQTPTKDFPRYYESISTVLETRIDALREAFSR